MTNFEANLPKISSTLLKQWKTLALFHNNDFNDKCEFCFRTWDCPKLAGSPDTCEEIIEEWLLAEEEK